MESSWVGDFLQNNGMQYSAALHPSFMLSELRDFVEEYAAEFDFDEDALDDYDFKGFKTEEDFNFYFNTMFPDAAEDFELPTEETVLYQLNKLAVGAKSLIEHKSFSGSTVFTAALNPLSTQPFVMKNSKTGFIGNNMTDVVKKWKVNGNVARRVTIPMSVKSSKSGQIFTRFKGSGKEATGHAEVNVYRAHYIESLENHKTLSEVPLRIATNIAHCAECWWAAHRIFGAYGVKFRSATKCENKLFKNWGEPWHGFYKSFGDNPFRDKDGDLYPKWAKVLGGKACAEFPAYKLNAEVRGATGDIYT